MGKITKKIREIQTNESLTLPEVFEKYPHLAALQFQELEEENKRVNESKKPELLFG